jgi:hypothetical protein
MLSREPLTLPKSTVLGIAEEVSEDLIDRMNKSKLAEPDLPAKPKRKKRDDALYNKLLGGKLNYLSTEERQIIEPVLNRYTRLFHDEETNYFNSTDVTEQQIVLEDTKPIKGPTYKTPFSLRGEMNAQVEDMLQKGVIREINSPWSAPAILVPKKSMIVNPKYRFCVDLCALNAATKYFTVL